MVALIERVDRALAECKVWESTVSALIQIVNNRPVAEIMATTSLVNINTCILDGYQNDGR